LNVDRIGVSLRRILDVRADEQLLNTDKKLLDRDRRLPVLVLVLKYPVHISIYSTIVYQKTEADRSTRVNVRVEKRRLKAAFRWSRREVVLEDHAEL